MAHGDSTSGLTSHFTSMFALPHVVGRDKELETIKETFRAKSPPRVFFILGEGGVGKTRLLRAALKVLREELGKDAYVAEREVDLYHTFTHTPNGLADALYQVASFLEEARIREVMGQLHGLWAAGVAGESAKLRKEHLDLFENILAKACAERPVIFALDTAERWVYTWMGEKFPLQHVADAWEWLGDLMAKYDNLYFIISGRPSAETLWEDLASRQVTRERLDLGPLNEDGVLAYFNAIREIARDYLDDKDENKRKDAEKIFHQLDNDNFPEEERRNIATWTGGHPIRLSLVIDFLLMGGSIKEILRIQSLNEPGSWEAIYFAHLAEHHPDIFDTIQAMAQLPKGATPALLVKIMECEEHEATERLKTVERYTFTKKWITPRQEERYFLHDELYNLLSDILHEDQGEQARVAGILETYYKERLKDLQKEITNAVLQVEEQGDILCPDKEEEEEEEEEESRCPDRENMGKYYLTRHALMTEDIYYVLRNDVQRGLRYRYRFTRSADLAGDVALDLALQAEVLNFFDEPGSPQKVDENLQQTIYGMMAMRPVVRAWVEEQYEEVITLAEALRSEEQFIVDEQNCAILDVWEAYAHIMIGENLAKAEKLLAHAIGETQPFEKRDIQRNFTVWRGKAILAFALRVRGYLRDNQGQLDDAIQDYRRAVKLWREVNLLMEVATTTKNLAFNLGRIGRYAEAEDLARNALEIYRQLGAPGQVALSLSAFAMIFIEERHYQDAQQLAQWALNINKCIQFTRGLGLAALAFSEATRRYAATSSLLSDADKRQRLELAQCFARQALKRLGQVNDRWYYIKALIEIGCVVRDKVRYCCPKPHHGSCKCDTLEVDRFRQESKEWLERAVQEAEASGAYRVLLADALVNIAWLGYYAHDEELIREAEASFREKFAEFFHSDAGVPYLSDNDIVTGAENKSIWQFIGKLHVMKGALAYRKYETTGEEEALEETGRLYTQALQYSTVRGDNYGTLLVGKQFIFNQLKTLPVPQLKAVSRGVKHAEQEFGWRDKRGQGNSVMRQFLEDRSLWYEEDENGGD